jgi:hypothetical protein
MSIFETVKLKLKTGFYNFYLYIFPLSLVLKIKKNKHIYKK